MAVKRWTRGDFLAQKCNADLDFVYVASNINKDIPSHIVFDRIWEKIPQEIKAAKHVETGNIPKAILKVADAEKERPDHHGQPRTRLFKGALIGSVSQKVVEESQIPGHGHKQREKIRALHLQCLIF